jgi:hypothetical protein
MSNIKSMHITANRIVNSLIFVLQFAINESYFTLK